VDVQAAGRESTALHKATGVRRMAYLYDAPSQGASVRLNPTRPPLAAAAHLGETWGAAVDALRANLIAVRAHLVEQDYPENELNEDDIALEVIDLVDALDKHDRYALRLVVAMLYRGATSKARNGNGHTD
jgi:hypothetical protein